MLNHKHNVLEICAGAGGQALGLEQAGFDLASAVEIDSDACDTLRYNRPHWTVLKNDIKNTNGKDYKGIDLFAGGVPCPPFSIAGKQLGAKDERDLFPEAIRIIGECKPKAILLENVRGFSTNKFFSYRKKIFEQLSTWDYKIAWKVINASDYGVPQLRPRFILVALKSEYASFFRWPNPIENKVTVADTIKDLMFSCGWQGGENWLKVARKVAPTLVGGSKKHGGADLGPTRAKQKWKELGIDGHGIANNPPDSNYPLNTLPRLTLEMVARIQGFPDDWEFRGLKTSKYRQIGNALPPPTAKAVGESINFALAKKYIKKKFKSQQVLFDEVCV